MITGKKLLPILEEALNKLKESNINIESNLSKKNIDEFIKNKSLQDILYLLNVEVNNYLERIFHNFEISQFQKEPNDFLNVIVSITLQNNAFKYNYIRDYPEFKDIGIIIFETWGRDALLIKTSTENWYVVQQLFSQTDTRISPYYNTKILNINRIYDVPQQYTFNEISSLLQEILRPLIEHDYGKDKIEEGFSENSDFYKKLVTSLIPTNDSYDLLGYMKKETLLLQPLGCKDIIDIYNVIGDHFYRYHPDRKMPRSYIKQLRDCIIYHLQYYLDDFKYFKVYLGNEYKHDTEGYEIFNIAIERLKTI